MQNLYSFKLGLTPTHLNLTQPELHLGLGIYNSSKVYSGFFQSGFGFGFTCIEFGPSLCWANTLLDLPDLHC